MPSGTEENAGEGKGSTAGEGDENADIDMGDEAGGVGAIEDEEQEERDEDTA